MRSPTPDRDDDTPARDIDAPSSQREGLPSHYRMRAERHYVDSVTSGSTGVPVRLIPIGQFKDTPTDPAPSDLEALIRSIRLHGVIQPLLVRKHGLHYEVIAGRRRLAAATAIGLTDVPCIVHQVDDAAAAALRSAENLHASASSGSLRASVGSQIASATRRIADDVSRLHKSVEFVRAGAEGFQHAVGIDLIAAQARRISWLANAVTLLSAGRVPAGRPRPLSAIIDEAVAAFKPESRLSGARFEIRENASLSRVDDSLIGIALTSGIVVTLALVDKVAAPRIEIQTQTLDGGGFLVEIIQRCSPVPQDLATAFSTRPFSVSGPLDLAIGAMILAHATAAHGGASELTSEGEIGGSVQLTFRRAFDGPS